MKQCLSNQKLKIAKSALFCKHSILEVKVVLLLLVLLGEDSRGFRCHTHSNRLESNTPLPRKRNGQNTVKTTENVPIMLCKQHRHAKQDIQLHPN